jgi:hypothetical protein
MRIYRSARNVTHQRGSDSDVILHKRQRALQLQDSKSIASRALEADIWPGIARQVHNDHADNALAKRLQVQGAA